MSKSAAVYFAIVFGVGFILGPLRVLWLAPRVGVRAAELIEIPLMLLAITYAARFIIDKYPGTPKVQLRRGMVALLLLLTAEIALGVALSGRTVVQVLVDRDPVSGTVYYLSLGLFAIMPWLLARRRGRVL